MKNRTVSKEEAVLALQILHSETLAIFNEILSRPDRGFAETNYEAILVVTTWKVQ